MRTVPTVHAEAYEPTRRSLHLVAVHVLARARHGVTGRFGLRVLPGGFGTPMFGSDERVLRVSGGMLFDERRTTHGPRTRTFVLDGAALADVAVWAGVRLDTVFSVGHDTPGVGDVHAPMPVDPAGGGALAAWLAVGASAIDTTVGRRDDASVLQLWPEHFDAGLDTAVPGGRANLGMSAGDGFCPEPYAYVGPWSADRPGDPSYWNAPFGAYLPASRCDSNDALAEFLELGLRLLGASDPA